MKFRETVKKALWCDLSEPERHERAMLLSALMKEHRAEEEKARQAHAKAKGELERLENRIAGLNEAVESRREIREVPCTWEYDVPGRTARLVRCDLGLVVETRELSDHDIHDLSQMDLYPEEAPSPTVPEHVDDGIVPSRDELEALLRANQGNLTAIGRIRGRDRTTIRRWCQMRELEPDAYRPEA